MNMITTAPSPTMMAAPLTIPPTIGMASARAYVAELARRHLSEAAERSCCASCLQLSDCALPLEAARGVRPYLRGTRHCDARSRGQSATAEHRHARKAQQTQHATGTRSCRR